MATGTSNLCNFFYHLYMVRRLLPDQYAMLTALIASMTILSVPAATVQTITAHRVASLSAQSMWEALRRDLLRRFVGGGLVAITFFGIITATHQSLMNFLQLPDVPEVVFAWGGAVALAFIVPIAQGAIQGLQSFTSLGINLMLHGVSKLGFGVLCVGLGWAVLGAVQALLIATLLILFVGLVQLRRALRHRHPRSREEIPWWEQAFTWVSDGMNECWMILRKPWGFSSYAVMVALSVMAYTSLTNVDIVLAKHYLSPLGAGYYAIAAMVSRSVLFLPMALSMVLFPKVAHATAMGEDARLLLRQVMTLTALLSGSACAVCLAFPATIIRWVAGTVYPETVPLTRALALAMACMAVSNLVLVYALAARRTWLVVPFIVAALGHLFCVVLWHAEASQIVWLTTGFAFLLATYSVVVCYDKKVRSPC